MIRIKNWSKHQHFKDRTPPWIKLYRDILDDPDWHELDGDVAKVLVSLWLIASEDETHTGALPDVRRLAFRLRMKESQLNQALTKLGHWLVQDDIKLISERHQVDAPETETDKETEGEKDSSRKRGPSAALPFQAWIDSVNAKGEEAIPASDPVFAYAEKARIPVDFISLAWGAFVRKAKDSGKKQKSWPQTFRNYVEGNYLKLWAISQNGDYYLTTAGKQEQMAEAEHA